MVIPNEVEQALERAKDIYDRHGDVIIRIVQNSIERAKLDREFILSQNETQEMRDACDEQIAFHEYIFNSLKLHAETAGQ